ncbi:hypothetical protein M2459_001008 [Parabacteroides sp. PF5-5]|uniref:hypothetical protein n=1 Tax=unclassified Parabacteroides TaxID=2649774 RepID=UPI002472EF6C|nr:MULTISPECIES: hypothetical protein [unclassified Parabacteroides]MDH6304280.1 hypothetical protein [Parabacteroides sp. PH5-39]MDH6315005.1 hypothetical protein [Parabacteroides sp. PF5-13]MDH6318665.1 hypothetical protein [Parabacteroides sp. PH5-13]MDH6322395.1 hypothetical protein [Parabacteroides sp. PH5-8]MDH6326470.1 hypothetical protein [Parabacteroides sp. PH5-41]
MTEEKKKKEEFSVPETSYFKVPMEQLLRNVANDVKNGAELVNVTFYQSNGQPHIRARALIRLKNGESSRQTDYTCQADENLVIELEKVLFKKFENVPIYKGVGGEIPPYEGNFEEDMLKRSVKSGKIPKYAGEFTDRKGTVRMRFIKTYARKMEMHFTPAKTEELINYLKEHEVINQESYFD